ncbi:phage baseplate assembly protein V [Vibrio sp. PP-XX7]
MTGTGDKFSDDNLITGIRHRFSSSHWFIDIDLGLPLNKTLYRDIAQKRPMPAVMGVVAKFKAYDKLPNTLPVIIPVFDKAKPLYARLAAPFASKEEGFFFPPQEGDEVFVSFVGGDPSYPMIVGACHNATNTPPFPYDEKMEKRGLFVKLKEAQMALLVDAAAKKLSLQVQKDDPVSIALSSTEVVITSKDKQTLTVADGTKFDGEKDVTITTKGAFKVDAGGAAEIKASATEIK